MRSSLLQFARLAAVRGAVVGLVATMATMPAACAKAPPAQGSGQSATAAKLVTPPAPAEQDLPREKKPRIGEAAIYVDGKPIAAIRVPELPPSVKPHDIDNGGLMTKRYFMGEYLKALGVDAAKVKAFHAYGGSRVAVVDGDEFRRIQNGLQLSFTQGDRGKPRLMWVVNNLKSNTTVDMISAIALYVDKEPPTLQNRHLAFADGKEIEGIPYAPQEMSKGTRVYIDGQLTATVKRKELGNQLLTNGDLEHPSFSLAGYLGSIGVDSKKAKAMDFVSGDDVILRMDSKTTADKFSFTLPRHNQGRIAVPAGNAKAAKVSALQIFIKTQPPARTIVRAEDEARDDADRQGGGGGGGDDEP